MVAGRLAGAYRCLSHVIGSNRCLEVRVGVGLLALALVAAGHALVYLLELLALGGLDLVLVLDQVSDATDHLKVPTARASASGWGGGGGCGGCGGGLAIDWARVTCT